MIILDASAAIDMARRTPEGEGLKELMLENEKVVSCDLYRAEIGNIVRKMVRAGKLAKRIAPEYFEYCMQLVDEFVPIEDLIDEAFRESLRLDHPTYDMLYFVLARRTAGTLFTLDKGLINLCADHGVNSIDLVPFPCDCDAE